MFESGAGLSEPLVAPLLASRQGLIPFDLALEMIAPSCCLELGLPAILRISSVGIDVPSGLASSSTASKCRAS